MVLERRGVRETWTSTSAGLQHTFEFDAATSADGVEVEIAVAGLTPLLVSDTRILFADAANEISYAGLAAFDADWRGLPAWFEVEGTTVRIRTLTDADRAGRSRSIRSRAPT